MTLRCSIASHSCRRSDNPCTCRIHPEHLCRVLRVYLPARHTIRDSEHHGITAQHVVHIVVVHIVDRPILLVLSRIRADVVIWWVELQMGSRVRANIPVRPLRSLWRLDLRQAKLLEIVLRITIGLFERQRKCTETIPSKVRLKNSDNFHLCGGRPPK
jgi:hypothetical protein